MVSLAIQNGCCLEKLNTVISNNSKELVLVHLPKVTKIGHPNYGYYTSFVSDHSSVDFSTRQYNLPLAYFLSTLIVKGLTTNLKELLNQCFRVGNNGLTITIITFLKSARTFLQRVEFQIFKLTSTVHLKSTTFQGLDFCTVIECVALCF